jgi:hypothetical protein
MNRVIAVVEGQTERTFVREVLGPWLGWRGVAMSARLVGKPGRKGGVGEFERARQDIVNLLHQETDTVVTTMFDYYGMPDSWPGRSQSLGAMVERRPRVVEEAILAVVSMSVGAGFDSRRFLPYVQMHEFEAILFSEPEILVDVMRDKNAARQLNAIRRQFVNPEEINDSPLTAPSKRILQLFPSYRKPLHGVLAAGRISIERIREECPHFNEWLTSLESLGAPVKPNMG